MKGEWYLSPERVLSQQESEMIWQKPASHKISKQEVRISNEVKENWHCGEMKITNILLEGDAGSGKTQLAKALSFNFGLPYTKITCFADMDKSDVLGAILPVLSEKEQAQLEDKDRDYLKTLYTNSTFWDAVKELTLTKGLSQKQANIAIKNLVNRLESIESKEDISYRYYPSEIVRAFEKGYLLEIQEPTVIRDAAVLMALNSALEHEGSMNLPTRVIERHPDFVTVITTNRGYNGCRPLNEALRDRIQHAEKMDLPSIEVMVERAIGKTGYTNKEVLTLLAKTINTLDQSARANAIKGVAGMRSYFFWVDSVSKGKSIKDTLYYKVIYKITTDSEEIKLLEEELINKGIINQLEEQDILLKKNNIIDSMELKIWDDGTMEEASNTCQDEPSIALKKASNSEGHSDKTSLEIQNTNSMDELGEGDPFFHQLDTNREEEIKEEKKFRKQLNGQARKSVLGTSHEGKRLIVHRPEVKEELKEEYDTFLKELRPTIDELVRKTKPVLEHETAISLSKNRIYGSQFCSENIAKKDFRYFANYNPPEEEPSLAVALRIDESASMKAFGRLEAAKAAAVAVYEYCTLIGIPVLVYGDTADHSPREEMSLFAYCDFEKPHADDCYRLMNIQARSNNRDGMAMRILGNKLLNTNQKIKLMICISDGQPKAMPNYTGDIAIKDMQEVIVEYQRKGIIFVAAAIGQDKEMICDIYGKEHFLDISDLKQLPTRLVHLIARYL